MLNTSPLGAGPLVGCPLCADQSANALTGSCSCPAGSELVQPIATVSDCAFKKLPGILRPSALGICLPIGLKQSISFGGAYQVDAHHDGYMAFAAGDGCRSPNLLTGLCSCPVGFSALNFTAFASATVPSEGQTELAHTTVAFCLPNAGHLAGFGGAFQSLDPTPAVKQTCAIANPTTGNCSCPPPGPGMLAASHAHRIITNIPGSASIVGSSITLCGEEVTSIEPRLSESAVEICEGVTVDSTGTIDASMGLQTCVDRLASAQGHTLSLPAGTYLLAHRIHINASTVPGRITLATAGVARTAPGCGMPTGPACAVLRAAVELTDRYGLLNAEGATLTIDHIVLDGNRGQRMDTGPAISCGGKWAGHEAEGRSPAYNAGIHGCLSCDFIGFASTNALCGTGLEYSGPDATFERALFINNGDHFGRQAIGEGHKWSDGLTIGDGPRCVVRDCLFADNSDINFIVANAHGGVIEGNTVRMVNGGSFGAIMMDDFNNPASANFSGALVTNNTIDCGTRCHYGIEIGASNRRAFPVAYIPPSGFECFLIFISNLTENTLRFVTGPRPWYTKSPIFGPVSVVGNTIGGAGFAINADGAGKAGAPITVARNKFIGACTTFPCVNSVVRYNCTAEEGPGFNISPDSHVDRQGETTPVATHYPITACP